MSSGRMMSNGNVSVCVCEFVWLWGLTCVVLCDTGGLCEFVTVCEKYLTSYVL